MNKNNLFPYHNVAKILGYLLLIYLSYSFLIHGISALFLNPGFIAIISGIGIPYAVSKVLVFAVGLADTSIAIMLFAYRKKWVIMYAALWPLVVMMGEFINSGHLVLGYFQYFVMGIIAYFIFFRYLNKK